MKFQQDYFRIFGLGGYHNTVLLLFL